MRKTMIQSWLETKLMTITEYLRHKKYGFIRTRYTKNLPGWKPSISRFSLVLFSVLSITIIVLSQPAQAVALAIQPYANSNMELEGIAPELKVNLDHLSEDEMVSVIVTLKDQANLISITDHKRDVRISKVIHALQNKVEATQRQIKAFLSSKQSAGEVESFESFWIFNGLSVTATSAVINELSMRPEVKSISPDSVLVAPATAYSQISGNPMEPNLNLINTQALWDMGYRGQGVVVANMDTGVSYTHPDLFSKWRGGTNSWYDPYGEHPTTPSDYNGHGTWTMGVLVGGESGGTAIGVAPDAQWIAVKIFNDQDLATVSAIHLGFQWLLDPDGDPNTPDAPNVVNNSWTYQNQGCYLEFELDLQSLRAADILPIFAAGNSGPYPGTSFSPANNPSAFAVGATDNNDLIYTGSSRGPSSCGEPESVFPELSAPGVSIHTSDLYGFFTDATGTSLAAPHVAGGLALLMSAFPSLSVDIQQTALINGAVDLGIVGPDNDFGNGRLDLLAAYQWLVSNTTPTPDPTINLALNRPVTVSSAQDSSHDGDMAVDGDLGTYWQTQKASGKNKLKEEWIVVDLGTVESVSRVVLDWGNNYATDYSIQVSSDQSQWVTVSATSAGGGGMDEVTFASTSARYIKLNSTAWSSGTWRNALQEFEVYSGSGGTSTPTPTPTSTSTPTPSPTPTPTPSPTGAIHIGDLSGFSSAGSRNRWDVVITVLVHDSNELPVEGVTVNYSWIDGVSGNGSCTTDTEGICTIQKNNLKANVGSVSLTVSDLVNPNYLYESTMNHDANGDPISSDITVLSP